MKRFQFSYDETKQLNISIFQGTPVCHDWVRLQSYLESAYSGTVVFERKYKLFLEVWIADSEKAIEFQLRYL